MAYCHLLKTSREAGRVAPGLLFFQSQPMGDVIDAAQRFTLRRYHMLLEWFLSGEPSSATMIRVVNNDPEFGAWLRAYLDERNRKAEDDDA